MNIQDLCKSTDVVAVAKNTSIKEAARLMKDKNIGAVVVVNSNEDKIPCGILTDRDIVVKMLTDDVDIKGLTVEDTMSSDLFIARVNQSEQEIIKTMGEKGIRRAPVVDTQGKLCGIITADDLVSCYASQLHNVANLINKQINEK